MIEVFKILHHVYDSDVCECILKLSDNKKTRGQIHSNHDWTSGNTVLPCELWSHGILYRKKLSQHPVFKLLKPDVIRLGMINRWSFSIKKTLYYNDLDTEDVILRPVNSDDDDNLDKLLWQSANHVWQTARFCRCRSCNRQGTMCLGPKHYEYVVQDGIVPLYSSVMPCLLAIAWNVGAMVRTSDGNWFDLQMFHFRPMTHKTYCATKLHALQPSVRTKRYRIAKCDANWPPLRLKMPHVSHPCAIQKKA